MLIKNLDGNDLPLSHQVDTSMGTVMQLQNEESGVLLDKKMDKLPERLGLLQVAIHPPLSRGELL